MECVVTVSDCKWLLERQFCLAVPALEAFGAAPQIAQTVRRFVAVGNPFVFLDAFFPEQTGANYQLPRFFQTVDVASRVKQSHFD